MNIQDQTALPAKIVSENLVLSRSRARELRERSQQLQRDIGEQIKDLEAQGTMMRGVFIPRSY